MRTALYFMISFALGISLGNFLIGSTPLFLSPFIAVQGSGTPQALATIAGTSALQLNMETVVSLLTALLLFAASFVLWKKFRAEHYFSRQETHWHTL